MGDAGTGKREARNLPLTLTGGRLNWPYYSGVARSLWSRVLAGVWGIWLTTSMSGMAGVHMSHGANGHGAGHAHVMEMGSAPPGSPVPAAEHAGHHDAQVKAGSFGVASKDNSHHPPAGFACLEQCCCGTPLAIAARAVALGANPRANALLQRYAEAVTARARRAHSQPFANGPPTAV
ncbi:MAG TPA: hypothetical protein VK542_08835 [Gemmatimonadaceae bacterium]|nr:hypothetical protein [Gemmatimonadaceae bacterium]